MKAYEFVNRFVRIYVQDLLGRRNGMKEPAIRPYCGFRMIDIQVVMVMALPTTSTPPNIGLSKNCRSWLRKRRQEVQSVTLEASDEGPEVAPKCNFFEIHEFDHWRASPPGAGLRVRSSSLENGTI